MKYVISWNERPQGSPAEYENAQKRILEVFGQWKAPENFKIEFFVVRVGDWGGHLLVDCDDPLTVHKFCSMLPAFHNGGTACNCRPGRSPGRTRSNGLARRPEEQVTGTGATVTTPLKPTRGLSRPPALVRLPCLSSSGLIGSRYEHGRTKNQRMSTLYRDWSRQ